MTGAIHSSIETRRCESLGDRVRRRRKEMKLTQAQLADKAGINQGFLSSIERGQRNASGQTLRMLADALELPEAVLLGAGQDHDAPQPLEQHELPLLGSIPAGPPSASQEQPLLFPVLRHLWAEDRFCLRLAWDSMEPTLKPDDIILVQYRPDVEPEHVQGRICACLVDGKPTLKRVFVDENKGQQVVVLRGDNPRVPPQIIDESSDFSIQGVILSIVNRNL